MQNRNLITLCLLSAGLFCSSAAKAEVTPCDTILKSSEYRAVIAATAASDMIEFVKNYGRLREKLKFVQTQQEDALKDRLAEFLKTRDLFSSRGVNVSCGYRNTTLAGVPYSTFDICAPASGGQGNEHEILNGQLDEIRWAVENYSCRWSIGISLVEQLKKIKLTAEPNFNFIDEALFLMPSDAAVAREIDSTKIKIKGFKLALKNYLNARQLARVRNLRYSELKAVSAQLDMICSAYFVCDADAQATLEAWLQMQMKIAPATSDGNPLVNTTGLQNESVDRIIMPAKMEFLDWLTQVELDRLRYVSYLMAINVRAATVSNEMSAAFRGLLKQTVPVEEGFGPTGKSSNLGQVLP